MAEIAWGVYRRAASDAGWFLVGMAWSHAAAKVMAWDVSFGSLTPVDTRIEQVVLWV